ncbi:MAG: hypothetical protein HOG89_02985 [Candidatus Peribacter sp.]|jgi:hypothetical protein|nr:hypothetical protein [Candidatus Peribacter sp.]MBT4392677.1 hypothetical protein [Candidatus Peribacter sp.]MBT4600706.1 hypothetical protein [Candidatus Peribacter sp.]MBT5148625.1 hypothetical protein [Candidatus Peribacter sp.]MBT5637779.1 hypothetical protein [Candidatus Peribacter sp.]
MRSLRRFSITLLSGALVVFPFISTVAAATYKTPDVFIEEISKFPGSIEGVESSIPSFIGGSEFQVDSFFDVFTEISVQDTCDPCKIIENEIAEKEARIAEIKLGIAAIDDLLALAKQQQIDTQEDIDSISDQLKEMQNPQNYVESEGRRYDSSDNAAMSRRSANLWDAYKSGDLSAQEYSDEIAKDFDDPEVAKELEKIKKEIIKELEEGIKENKDLLDDLSDIIDLLNENAQKLTKELKDCLDKLEELMKALEACKKQCKEGPIDVGGLGLTPEPRGFVDSFFDIFRGPEPILPGVDTVIERLDPQLPGGAGQVPIELVELSLTGTEPIQVNADSFFDVFFEIDVPAQIPETKCHMCDPLAKEIAKKEAKLKMLREAVTAGEALVKDIDTAISNGKEVVEEIKEELKKLENPTDYVESEGRRFDSADHAAMQVRNQRLWGDYRSGKLSAQQLETEWEKPFDDPDVAKELDKIKDQLADELEDVIEESEELIEDLEAQKKEFEDAIIGAKIDIGLCNTNLAAMRIQLADCEKRCKSLGDAIGFIDDLLKQDPPIWNPPEREVDTNDSSETFDPEDPEDLDDVPNCLAKENTFSTTASCMAQCETKHCVLADGAECYTCVGGECKAENNEYPTSDSCFKTCDTKHCVKSEGSDCFYCVGGECKAEDNEYPTADTCFKTCDTKHCVKSEGSDCHYCVGGECKAEDNEYPTADSCFKTCDTKHCVKSEGSDCHYCVKKEPKVSFICDWFGVFCPKPPEASLDSFIGCAEDTDTSADCSDYDHNEDGTVDAADLSDWDLSLQGPGGISFPLIVDGFDGDPGVSVEDINALNDCLSTGGSTCDGLDFGLPPPDILFGDDLLGLGGNGFGLHAQNGNDVLLGDPLPPGFFGSDGLNDIAQPDGPPIPPDFFGPGSDPFTGPGGPVDVTPFGQPDPGTFGGIRFDPVLPPPVQPQTEQVPQAVQDLIAKIIRDNPLEPCEKLIISVRRIRIGNRVSYTVTVRRERDEEKCAPKCDKIDGFNSMEDCQSGCLNPDSCGYDGGLCWTCSPEIFEDGFESGDTSKWSTGDDVVEEDKDETEDDEGETDLCKDSSRCDDADECTQDNCDPETGACSNTAIPGCGEPERNCSNNDILPFDSKAACQAGSPLCPSQTAECQSHDTDEGMCWGCVPKEVDKLSPCRESDRWVLESEARSACSSQKKIHYRVTDECWGCKADQCDSPLVDHAGATALESDGYECSPVRKDSGLTCYDCKEVESDPPPPQCDAGLVSDCGQCPSGTECGARNSNGCHICNPVDTGPSCPSGTTASQSDCESQCPSDGICIGEDGCYSCVVVNCPSGTTRDECPSSCSNGCDVAGEQHGVKCYQCKQDCETACSSNGYGPESTDHSDAILSELNGYSCVSGASISIQTATIGECNCIGEYSLSVDTTPPVCAGTPCGDVECGGSASCPGGPNETITVNCNWGGWEKLQKHQFRPVVGN